MNGAAPGSSCFHNGCICFTYKPPRPPSGWQVSHRGPIKCLHPVVAVCLCVLTCTKSGIMIPGMAVLKGFARVKCEHLYANWIVSRLDVSLRRSLLSCFSVYRSVMFISQKELHIISKLYLAWCWDPHFVFTIVKKWNLYFLGWMKKGRWK